MDEIEAELEADFPSSAPRARGLYDIPEGHNLDKAIDGDFRDSIRVWRNRWEKRPTIEDSREGTGIIILFGVLRNFISGTFIPNILGIKVL